MATAAAAAHLQSLWATVKQCDGQALATLLTRSHDKQFTASLFTSRCDDSALVKLVRSHIGASLQQQTAAQQQAFIEIITAHILSVHATWAYSQQPTLLLLLTAYSHANSAAEEFYRYIEIDNGNNASAPLIWVLPAINVICSQLRVAATTLDHHQQKNPNQSNNSNGSQDTHNIDNSNSNTSDKHLMITQELLRKYLQKMIVDRSPLNINKKLGCLFIINQLFKIYFQINNLRLCTHLINMVKMLPPLTTYPQSHVVTYHYYLGRLMVFEENYQRAEQCLEYAYQHTHMQHSSNKTKILQFLIPVRMLSGTQPLPQLLHKYSKLSEPFRSLFAALPCGNLQLYQNTLYKHRNYFIQKGVYLLLEKLKLLVYRNLFRKMSIVHRNNALHTSTGDNSSDSNTGLPALSTAATAHQIPLTLLQAAVNYRSVDDNDLDSSSNNSHHSHMSIDELECIIANLIYYGYIKGYIAHRRMVVLSKTNAFPPVNTVQTPP